MVDQLIEGIGDEVLLFVAFLFLTICMLIYVSLKRNQSQPPGTQQQNEGQMQERDVTSTAGSSTNLNDDDRSNFDTATDSSSDTTANLSRDSSSDIVANIPSDLSSDIGANLPSDLSSDIGANLPSDSSSEQPQRQSDEGPTIRARFPQSHGSTDESLSIRLILPNNTTLSVNVQRSTTLREMRSTYFQEELSEHRPVRFIYQGRVLDNDTQTLQDLEIGSNHAIHVHIGRPTPRDTEGTQNFGPRPPGEMLDLSRLFLPLFGLIVAICWVCMFCYPDVFTLLTKILLFILSIVYMFLAYVTH